MTCKWGLQSPFRNKFSINTQIKKANEMCLALQNVALFVSKSFVVVWILINDPCLCHMETCTVELQGLQKTWTHANRCVLLKTQSQYLLLFWRFRTLEPRHLTLTFRLGYDLLQLGGCSMGWWRLALDMRVSLDWKRQRTKSRWQRTAGLQVCSFHSLVNESWALQWVCEIPPGLLPPSGQFGWLNPPHSKVTHTWYWHQDA